MIGDVFTFVTLLGLVLMMLVMVSRLGVDRRLARVVRTKQEINREVERRKSGAPPWGACWPALLVLVALPIVFYTPVGLWLGAYKMVVVNLLTLIIPTWTAYNTLFQVPRRQMRLEHDVTELDRRVCPQCLYPLTGLDDVGECPECGQDYAIETIRAYWEKVFASYQACWNRSLICRKSTDPPDAPAAPS